MSTNRISAMFDSMVDNILLKSAEKIANDARASAPTQRIKANINVSAVENTSQGKQIRVYVPLEDAPEARAYELGSGIHGAEHATYPIEAKNVPNLVFFWEKADRYFVGPRVDHPGVAARPYLFPAVAKNKNTILGLLSRGLGALIRTSVTAGFREKTK